MELFIRKNVISINSSFIYSEQIIDVEGESRLSGIKINQKVLRIVLVLIIVFSSFANQDTKSTYAAEVWHEITNRTQLEDIKNDLTANYRLMADIDLTGTDWIPLGSSGSPFTGKFDGNSRVIRNLTITDTTKTEQGLFAVVDTGGEISKLGIEEANITAANNTGILAGINNGAVSQCYTKGKVNGFEYAGGLVGQNTGSILNSYSQATVSGKDYLGGFTGSNSGTVQNCYTSSPLTASVFNNYLEFNGTPVGNYSAPNSGGYINIPHKSDYVGNQFTLEAWFQWDDVGTSDCNFIIGKGYEQFEIHTGGGSGVNGIRFIPIWNNGGDSWIDVKNVIQPGWFHVAAVYAYNSSLKQATARVYINGVAQTLWRGATNLGTTATLNRDTNTLGYGMVGGALVAQENPINIGRRTDGWYYFDGRISDVRFWNIARTAEDINRDKDKVLTGTETGLVGYWKLNESSGNALDSTPTHNNGTLTGDVTRKSELAATHKGGLIGSNSGTVTNSFYDSIVDNLEDGGPGLPKTTAELKTPATFTGAGWDFTNVWNSSGNYPFLREQTYTVSFDSNGGSPIASLSGVKYQNTIAAPSVPTKTGYTFEGWYKEPALSSQWNFAADTLPAKDINLYAKWIQATPSFTPAGGAVASGTAVTITSEGAEHIYYTTDGSNPGTAVGGSTLEYMAGTKPVINSAITIKAIAIKSGVPNSTIGSASYTLQVADSGDSSGGSSVSPSPSGSNTVNGEVIDGKTGETVKGLEAQVSTQTNGTTTVEVKSQEAILIQQPDGTQSPVSDLSKVGFSAAANPEAGISMKADGTIQISNLAEGTDSTFAVTFDLGNGQIITIGTIEVQVGANGEVSITSTLIDPYGIITDPATGEPIAGAKVTLYYADTERNRKNGRTPDTSVDLPILEGFKPNNNKNPQVSDKDGAYAFMVFPTADYYLMGEKDGYEIYKSITISVEQEIVKWNFKMNKSLSGIHRLSGESRVDTALAIAAANYTAKLKNVVLATAADYPDALAGSVLAYKLNAPILLVGSSQNDQTKILEYMKANLVESGAVYILGGTGVIDQSLEDKISAAGFKNLTRLSGSNRSATALKIADQLEVPAGRPVILVNEANYADALSVSSSAAAAQYPIFLIEKDRLSAEVKARIAELKTIKVFMIGGEGVISSQAAAQVAETTGLSADNIVRISGEDRYATSLAVAKYFALSGNNASLATGRNFPDALAGSVYAANYNAPVILVDDKISEETQAYLKTRKMTGGAIFGGQEAMGESIEQQLLELMVK